MIFVVLSNVTVVALQLVKWRRFGSDLSRHNIAATNLTEIAASLHFAIFIAGFERNKSYIEERDKNRIKITCVNRP